MNGSGNHDSPRKSRSGETKRRADARAVPASRSYAQTDRRNLGHSGDGPERRASLNDVKEMKTMMKTKGKTAATAAHDLQAGGAYRMAVCARCGAAFAYPNARKPRTVCDGCKLAAHAASNRRDRAANAYGRDDVSRITRENAEIRQAQRGRAAARRAALRERDAEHAAWCAANGATPVRIVTRADGTVVETRGHVCGVGAPAKPFTPGI